jgi:hypothetical protein
MVLNLDVIVATPYFRSYWVQRNVTGMKQYLAAICDLHRTGGEYREERVLLRRSTPETPRAAAGSQAAAELAALVPTDGGMFRAVADPSADEALAALGTKLLGPSTGPQPPARTAPSAVAPAPGDTGGGADLETRIDPPPPARIVAGLSTDELKRVLNSAGVTAMLELQSSTPEPSGVFVRMRSLVALAATSEWRLPDVESAIVAALQPGLTAGRLGITWQQNKAGYVELDGLMPIAIAVRGKQLFVSNDAALLGATLANTARKPESQPAVYIAGFDHAHERGNFDRLAGVLGRTAQLSNTNPAMAGSAAPINSELGREPDFLSQNIDSLGRTFAGVVNERVTVRDNGDRVLEQVVYQWKR